MRCLCERIEKWKVVRIEVETYSLRQWEINKFLSDQKDAENVAALKIINGHYRDRFMKCKNIL